MGGFETPRTPIGIINEERDTPMPASLQHYHNARVTIHYNAQGYSDTGTVTHLDNYWIELTKDGGERLLVPIVAVRLIKMLEASRAEEDATILLRPAEHTPEQKRIPRE